MCRPKSRFGSIQPGGKFYRLVPPFITTRRCTNISVSGARHTLVSKTFRDCAVLSSLTLETWEIRANTRGAASRKVLVAAFLLLFLRFFFLSSLLFVPVVLGERLKNEERRERPEKKGRTVLEASIEH